VLDKVVPDLRVVPSAEDGRLGSGVVLVKEFLVLLLLQLGSVVGAICQYYPGTIGIDTHMTPSEMSQSLIWLSDQEE
jgi:hypothetical protein